ncbi:MAG: replicative DNA helicase [candidate division WOR-3 bacterium]
MKNNKNEVNISEKTPPQANEVEQAVLGAMLLEPEAVVCALEYLDASCFYLNSHKKIFQALSNLFERNVAIDVLTAAEELNRMQELENIGGREYLSTLVELVETTANIEEHCKLVLEKAVQRKLIQTATQIVSESYSSTVTADELLDRAEHLIFEIKERKLRRGLVAMKDLFMPLVKKIEDRFSDREPLTRGLKTGFDRLDELTSGFQQGDLIIIAGRPTTGKTSLALNIATNVTKEYDRPVAIFSLEMTTETLIERIICSEAGIPFQTIRSGKLSRTQWNRLSVVADYLKRLPIYIDDSASLKVLEIKAKARRLKAESDLAMIIIDYIQLCEPSVRLPQRTRQQEISDISRALKGLAKELNVAVVALSQLSRMPERREDKRPQLADLRESGAIEQDADMVLMLYRPEVYLENRDKPELQGYAELNIAKQRNGPTDIVKLTYRKEIMKFENYIPEPSVPLPDFEDEF